jgi:hypothetical protein
MISFYDNLLNSARDCIQTTVTAAMVIKNEHMSSRWKDELVGYGICKQPLSCFVHILPLKPDRSSVCPVYPESFQHLILTSKSHRYQTVYRNRPYE